VPDLRSDSAASELEGVEELAMDVKTIFDAESYNPGLPAAVRKSWRRFMLVAVPATRTDLMASVGDYILSGCQVDPASWDDEIDSITCATISAHLLNYYQRGDIKDLNRAVTRAEWLGSHGGNLRRLTIMAEGVARGWAGLPPQPSDQPGIQRSVSASDSDVIPDLLDLVTADIFNENQAELLLARLDEQIADEKAPDFGQKRMRLSLRLRLLRTSASESDRNAVLNDLVDFVGSTTPGTWDYASSRLDFIKWLRLNPGSLPEKNHQTIPVLLTEIAQDQNGWALTRLNAASRLSEHCLLQGNSEPGRWLRVMLAGFVAAQVGRSLIGLSGTGAELILDRIQGLATRGAYAALKTGDIDAALLLLEGGTGMLTAKRLELQRAQMRLQTQGEPRAEHDKLLARFRDLGSSIGNEWAASWGTADHLIANQERLLAWDKLSTSLNQWGAMRQEIEGLAGVDVAEEFFTPEKITALAADTGGTVVYAAAAPGEGFALVVSADSEPEIIWLQGLSEEQVAQWTDMLSAVLDSSIEKDSSQQDLAIEKIVDDLANALDPLPSGRLLLILSALT
jgi:hypothetical protein